MKYNMPRSGKTDGREPRRPPIATADSARYNGDARAKNIIMANLGVNYKD
jgi:hypothetical protein